MAKIAPLLKEIFLDLDCSVPKKVKFLLIFLKFFRSLSLELLQQWLYPRGLVKSPSTIITMELEKPILVLTMELAITKEPKDSKMVKSLENMDTLTQTENQFIFDSLQELMDTKSCLLTRQNTTPIL